MMRSVMAASAALVLLGFATPAAAAPSGAPPAAAGKLARGQPIPPDDLERFVDGAVRDAMEGDHIAGVSVAIVQGGGISVLKGYGVAGPGQPMDPARTLVRIGSLSKTFVWISLLKEVERGRIGLEAPVNDYLPQRLKIPDQGFDRPIRVIDLMSHAAGFEDTSLGHLFVYSDDEVTPLADYLARHRPRRVREPGQFASYSNYGAALAGYIVARVNGHDFETVAERELFAPLGMTSTTFREPYAPKQGLPAPMAADQAERLSDGFVWRDGRFARKSFEHISQIAPAGAASATAADMARYMLALGAGGSLDGARIYGPATARAIRTPVLRTPAGVNGWAHGFMARSLPGGLATYGHGGATEVFFTNLMMVPELDLGVFANSNSTTGRGLVERLPRLIVEHFYLPPPAPPLAGDPALVADADRYAGVYIPTRRAYGGLETFVNLLRFDDRVWVSVDGYLITKTGSLTQAWVPDGAPGHFRAADGGFDRMVFKLDTHGRAFSFPLARGNYTLERAGPLLDPRLFAASAVLVLGAASVVWIGAFSRFARRSSPTRPQALAGIGALGASALWLAALALFKASGLQDGAGAEMSGWPGPMVLATSVTALIAAIASLALLALTPLTWRGPGGWPWWRKGLHAATALVFVLFASLVAVRGGLTPWA